MGSIQIHTIKGRQYAYWHVYEDGKVNAYYMHAVGAGGDRRPSQHGGGVTAQRTKPVIPTGKPKASKKPEKKQTDKKKQDKPKKPKKPVPLVKPLKAVIDIPEPKQSAQSAFKGKRPAPKKKKPEADKATDPLITFF